ncbi:uncharacterized protein LODBEIA_P06580 [Lodderomyces beijingensis]|uniref:Uncharacterized protein n=1 Tax=Lodderomyces beijingensis TaxID=1775926 RepID=A0ABP0ZE24_9ASCO
MISITELVDILRMSLRQILVQIERNIKHSITIPQLLLRISDNQSKRITKFSIEPPPPPPPPPPLAVPQLVAPQLQLPNLPASGAWSFANADDFANVCRFIQEILEGIDAINNKDDVVLLLIIVAVLIVVFYYILSQIQENNVKVKEEEEEEEEAPLTVKSSPQREITTTTGSYPAPYIVPILQRTESQASDSTFSNVSCSNTSSILNMTYTESTANNFGFDILGNTPTERLMLLSRCGGGGVASRHSLRGYFDDDDDDGKFSDDDDDGGDEVKVGTPSEKNSYTTGLVFLDDGGGSELGDLDTSLQNGSSTELWDNSTTDEELGEKDIVKGGEGEVDKELEDEGEEQGVLAISSQSELVKSGSLTAVEQVESELAMLKQQLSNTHVDYKVTQPVYTEY